MERISKKVSFVPKAPVAEVETATKNTLSTLSKWIPLLCAGAAAGVSIIALKEIKNVRRELMIVKKEQNPSANVELNNRMKSMEDQLKLLTDFIKNKDKVTKETEIIKNVVKEQPPVTIINNDEYEEVEVTDDETDEIEKIN